MEKKTIIVISVVVVIIVAALGAVLLTNKGSSNSEGISESGSTTMAEVAALWATEFKNETGIKVTIDTPGSGTGITNFIQGKADIAQCSRAMKQSEKDQASANNITVTEWKVAVDGIAIITNKNNPVTSLSIDQLKGIYNGTITNWNQVGGNDQAIVLYGRDSASGSYASFKDMVLGTDNYSSSMQQFNTNALILPEVENNVGGIGYVGVGYAKEASGQLNIVSVSKSTGGTAYSPLNQDAVYAGSVNSSAGYPLSRFLYLYTDGVPAKDSSQYKWISFVLGTKGQGLVNEAGFYELQSSDLTAMQNQLATAK
ncbi:MAG: PstS family phosphate ABC transporter substrate-binding protein [Methanomassiliicoccus sp.]|nr:PstS family phosphate ABC transporter substrate-binding protein [Methanomassiliicoccus sp.]